MQFHTVDTGTQFRKMRELVPEAYRAFLDFDQKAFKDGAIPAKMKELMAVAIAQITQCPWCIDAHTKKAAALEPPTPRLPRPSSWRWRWPRVPPGVTAVRCSSVYRSTGPARAASVSAPAQNARDRECEPDSRRRI